MAERKDHTLSLVVFDSRERKLSADDKLKRILTSVESGLRARGRILKEESDNVSYDMGQAVAKLNGDILEADLRAIRVATWFRVSTEYSILQRVRKMILSSLSGAGVDDQLSPEADE